MKDSTQNLNLDLSSAVKASPDPSNTLIQQYTFDLLASGRDDAEIVDGLESYYAKLH